MSTTSADATTMSGQSEELGRYALIQHSILTIQCLCGMGLNTGVLVLFFLMKQVRGSVYAAYMIQIAITDVLVCITWLTFSSWIISHVRNVDRGFDQLQENQTSSDEFSYSDATLDVITLIYNFHFYINIFLLAAMSVERFVAVWKSLRCQRYQFNKKFTYAVSATMWFMAFLCILPNIVDRELGTGISSNIQSIPPNLTIDDLMNDPFLRDRDDDWGTLLDCIKPYTDASEYKATHLDEEVYVESVYGVSVPNCTVFMQNLLYDVVITKEMLQGMNDNFGNVTETQIDDDSESIEPFDYEDAGGAERSSLIIYRLGRDSAEPKMMPVVSMDEYYLAVLFAFEHLKQKSLNEPNHSVCVPPYTPKAKIYNIVVNVTIGFFLPYVAIVCSYLGIAYMISKRAQQRLDSDHPANQHTSISDLGRRMSGFFRSIAGGGGGHSTMVGQTTVVVSTPATHHQSMLNGKTDEIPEIRVARSTSGAAHPPITTNIIASHNSGKNISPHIPLQQQQQHASHIGESKFRYGSSSIAAAAQLRRISGGSASSGESFLTDQTSLQTSPGVRLSQPLFIHDKSQQQRQMQRAVSADSGTASITPTYLSNGSHVRHHSNDFMFRPACDDVVSFTKKDILIEEIPETISETSPFQPHHRTTGSGSDKTIALASGEANGAHEPQRRLGVTKVRPPSKHEHVESKNGVGGVGKDRSRLLPEMSRSSGAAEIVMPGKTTAHRNAERHMKIARTVTAYVIVFSLCWLPQRVELVIYTMEGMKDVKETTCHTISIVLRIISFFSVLLNPIVYATTQRDIRSYIRRLTSRFRKRWQNARLNKCMKTAKSKTAMGSSSAKKKGTNNCDKDVPPTLQQPAHHQTTKNCETTAADGKNAAVIKENAAIISDKFQQDRHNKHLERRIWLAHRLSRTNPLAFDAAPPHDDGTIDEEVTPLTPRVLETDEAPTSTTAAFLKQDWPRLAGIGAEISTDCEKLNESVL